MDIRDFKNKLLREDIKDFQIGKTTETPSGKTTITDIDPETQSVTWTVNKDLTDSDIHRDLSKLIDKLESNQKRYHDQKRIKQLLQKLKFIRNTFKRTSIEEIKIDNPIPDSYVIEDLYNKLMNYLYSLEDEGLDEIYDELNVDIYDALEDFRLGGVEVIKGDFDYLSPKDKKEVYNRLQKIQQKYNIK